MFTVRERVKPSHLGKDRNIRLSKLTEIIQDACKLQLDNCEVTQEYYKRCNATTYIIYWQMDLLGDFYEGQEIDVTTFVYNMKKTYGERNVLVRDADGKLLVAAVSGGANVDKDTGEKNPMPKDILEIYPTEEKWDMEYLSRKVHFPADAEEQFMEPVKVTKSMIDYNGHVNNARYLDICEEYVRDDFDIGRFMIAYQKPAKYGDIIHPVLYDTEDQIGIALEDENRETYIKVIYYRRGSF